VEFSWLALGSQSRREAAPGSDVASAIVWYGDVAEQTVRPYLHALARDGAAGVERCGIRVDSYGATASDVLFVRSLESWTKVARGWIERPTAEQALILVSVLVDSRPVWGVHSGACVFRPPRTIGRALLHDGGAIGYSQLGAYRYLVHIAADAAPRDRMRNAVDVLIAYDKRRRSSLLDTLERYLAERRSVIESARALFIHPNTLRQRLARIEELTGVELDHDDLLSLELAIKLARLHGRPGTPGAAETHAAGAD
jgi:hypothetical protein